MDNEASNAARAARVRMIRDALGMTQPEFANRLNAAAAELGLGELASYTQLGVSQRETARLALDVEDYVIISHVDPHHRTILWLAFGRELPMVSKGLVPRPPKATPGSAASGRGKQGGK